MSALELLTYGETGEVMHTLKITAPGAEAIARNLPRWLEGAA